MHHSRSKCANQRGYTIAELSIVLALSVIFLLSVIKIVIPTGQTLIKRAEVDAFLHDVSLVAKVRYLSDWNANGRCMSYTRVYTLADLNTSGQLNEYMVGSDYHFDTGLVRVKTRQMPNGLIKGLSVVIQTAELDYQLTSMDGFSRLSGSSPYLYDFDAPIRFYDEESIYHQSGGCLE